MILAGRFRISPQRRRNWEPCKGCFSEEITDHVFCQAILNPNLFRLNPISDKEITHVPQVSSLFPTGRASVAFQSHSALIVLVDHIVAQSESLVHQKQARPQYKRHGIVDPPAQSLLNSECLVSVSSRLNILSHGRYSCIVTPVWLQRLRRRHPPTTGQTVLYQPPMIATDLLTCIGIAHIDIAFSSHLYHLVP